MLENLLVNIIPFTILFSLGIANTYEEKTVYTQALLTVTYGDNKKVKLPTGHYVQKSPTRLIKGELFYAGHDIDWCSTIPSTVKIPQAKPPWIALFPPTDSKNCTCINKINLAIKMNASAVLVYQYGCSVYETEEKNIISVVISHEDGKQLVYYMTQKPNAVVCEIKMGKKMIEKQFRVSKTSVLFVLVSFILLMCISLAWLVFYYVQRFRHIYRNDRKEKQLLSAAKKAISKLKTISFQAGNREGGEEETCAVCLENYKEGENIRILPCKHEFHKACIDPWLLNHRTCPMCKNNILKSLGVEIPDNIDLSQHDMESRRTSGDAGTVHSSPAPSAPPPLEPMTDEGVEPSTSVFTPGGSTSQAWSEQNVVSASCYSSTSSMLSDTDSERSTVALVSVAQKV